jgi:hypothetical protein
LAEEAAGGCAPKDRGARRLGGHPGLRSGEWSASTVNGRRQRMEGILINELSLGCLVWNLQRFVEDFKTGKRVSLVHPQHEWITSEVPAFQSVDDETWAKAHS